MKIQGLKLAVLTALMIAGCGSQAGKSSKKTLAAECPLELVVLGIGQDAGAPQIGNPDDPAWSNPSKRLYATSLGLLDHENGKRYLFEATPDIREQMQILDEIMPARSDGPYVDGVFLTHAHIGHYAGLMFLGRESMGTKGVPVFAMPRMADYLENNGPWSQLVALGNIDLKDWIVESDLYRVELEGGNYVFAKLVPHRDEYSETAAFYIASKRTSALFVPDIDDWESWQTGPEWGNGSALIQYLKEGGYAFVDATFYNDNELPGRDMSKIPHPRVTETMELAKKLGNPDTPSKIHFIHINHTNPIRDPKSSQSQFVEDAGFNIARRGDRFCL